MKFIIIGRDGSGKTTLAHLLQQKGLSLLKTYTTRPKRSDTEDTYHFISPEEAKRLKGKCLQMTYNNHEYFALEKDVLDADVLILDPNGLYELIEALPDESLHVIWIKADEEQRTQKAASRGDNPETESKIIEERKADPRFDLFEERMKFPVALSPNTSCLHEIQNDFKPEKLRAYADVLLITRQMFSNTKKIVERSVALGLVQSKNNKISVTQKDGVKAEYPIEIATDIILSSKESLDRLLSSWLLHETQLTF